MASGPGRPNPSALLRRAVVALKAHNDDAPRDYELGLCLFCGMGERAGHGSGCPWPEMEAEVTLPDQLQADVAYMPVPRCSACRWWKPFAAELQPAALGKIAEDLANVDIGLSGLPDLGDCRLFECRDREQVHESSKLIVTRTISGQAVISTYADFGCVQFEPLSASGPEGTAA